MASQLQPPVIRVHGKNVVMSCGEGDAIFVTTDGHDPTPASSEYSGPLTFGIAHLTIKAIAVREGLVSAVAQATYNHQPRSLVMAPEEGTFDGEVTVSILSEECDARYTLDGSIPTADSTLYTGPILINRVGETHVCAALYDGTRIVGNVVRHCYRLMPEPLRPPQIQPVSGSYDAPLRITIAVPTHHDAEAAHQQGTTTDIYYTLDGSDPRPTASTSSAVLYTGPIVVSAAYENLIFQAVALSAHGGELSEVTRAAFAIRQPNEAGAADGGNRASATGGVDNNAVTVGETIHPIENVEFDTTARDAASKSAEEVMAWLLATAQLRERRATEVGALEQKIVQSKQCYSDGTEQLVEGRKRLTAQNMRLSQLHDWRATHLCPAQQDLTKRITDSRKRVTILGLQETSVDTQLEEALQLHAQSIAQKAKLVLATRSTRGELEARYLRQKKQLLKTYSPSLFADLNELQMVVAEQRHELRLLRETLAAAQPRDALESLHRPLSVPFLPERRVVDHVPRVETLIPVPQGLMRLITTVSGNGLQLLRQKHSVEACIVPLGGRCEESTEREGRLAIKVIGHSMGVHRFVEDVQSALKNNEN